MGLNNGFSVPTDPTGRLGHNEAFESARASAVDARYAEYLARTKPEQAAQNARMEEADRAVRARATLDREVGDDGDVRATIGSSRKYLANALTTPHGDHEV